jgi:hypothetical protein
MDFDNIIPIIIVLVYIISSILKAKSLKEGKSPEKPSGLKKMFNNIAAQAREAMDEQVPVEQKGRGGWDELIVEEAQPPVRPIKKRIKKKAPPLVSQEKAAERGIRKTEQISEVQENKHYVSRKYNVRDLKKAVVWSEILGPPVALRDE